MQQQLPAMRQIMTVLRARSGTFAWLGTLLLAFNLFAAALLPVHSAKAADVAGLIEICTPDGMVWVDSQGLRLKPEKPAHDGVICQFCLPMLHAAASVSAPPTFPAPTLRPFRGEVSAPAATLPDLQRRVVSQPRAPPAI